jgi:hypothetical protein
MLQTESLKITPEILGLIAELDEFKGAWLAVFPHPVKPCPFKAVRQPTSSEFS